MKKWIIYIYNVCYLWNTVISLLFPPHSLLPVQWFKLVPQIPPSPHFQFLLNPICSLLPGRCSPTAPISLSDQWAAYFLSSFFHLVPNLVMSNPWILMCWLHFWQRMPKRLFLTLIKVHQIPCSSLCGYTICVGCGAAEYESDKHI